MQWRVSQRPIKFPWELSAHSLDSLTALTEKIKGLGVEDMVIDSGRTDCQRDA